MPQNSKWDDNEELYHPPLPDGIEPFRLQLAGHTFSKHEEDRLSILCNPAKKYVLKPLQRYPRGVREREFYKKIWNGGLQDESLLQFRSFIPAYFGTVDLKIGSRGRVLARNHIEPAFIRTTKEVTYIQLEDLTAPFRRPCLLDVKIGAITWDPDASVDKIKHEKSKYPPAKILGFRLLGMKYLDPVTGGYITKDKIWGKNLDEHMVKKELRQFFGCHGHAPTAHIVIDRLLSQLRPIERWFSAQKLYAFYSSSILIIYDTSPPSVRPGSSSNSNSSCSSSGGGVGDGCFPQEEQRHNMQNNNTNGQCDGAINDYANESDWPLVTCHMIDFTHTVEPPMVTLNCSTPVRTLDMNYLSALRMLISVVEHIKLTLP